MILIPPEIETLIQDSAKSWNLDAKLVSAIVLHESISNPWLTRFEPNWRYFYYPEYFSKINHVSLDTEKTLQAMSWGLMQVMGAVTRELGFTAELTKLVTPELSLIYGCKKLSSLAIDHPVQNDLIASYNHGSVAKNEDGSYVNQDYVDAVNKALAAFNSKILN